MEADKP
jgi:hypothetical protein